MTDHLNARSSWIRQRTFELQQSGMRYIDAHNQAEAEADDEFNSEDGNGGSAS